MSITIVAKDTNLPDEVISLSWEKNNFAMQLTKAISTEMQNQADFLAINGYISKSPDLTSTFFRNDKVMQQ